MATENLTHQDDYEQMEFSLEEAQRTLNDVLSSLRSDGLDDSEDSIQDQNIVDFESIFERNGLIDLTKKGLKGVQLNESSPVKTSSSTYSTLHSDRPMTLSRPVQLPSCCNFKRQHWKLYVQGQFSYSSLPRNYRDADDEFNASYKDDLEKIIEDFSEIRKDFESNARNKNQNINCDEFSSMHSFDNLQENVKVVVGEDDVVVPVKLSAVDSKETFDRKSLLSDQNQCLMEDINKNCENIKHQLLLLSNVSKFDPPGKPTAPVKPRSLKGHAMNSHKGISAAVIKQSKSSFETLDKLPSVSFLDTPPPPPPPDASPEFLSKSELSSSCSASPNKKLKSKRSRNRSLQRCNERKISGAERRSRTLSPAITERFDYKVSRATQTNISPDCVNFEPFPHDASVSTTTAITNCQTNSVYSVVKKPISRSDTCQGLNSATTGDRTIMEKSTDGREICNPNDRRLHGKFSQPRAILQTINEKDLAATNQENEPHRLSGTKISTSVGHEGQKMSTRNVFALISFPQSEGINPSVRLTDEISDLKSSQHKLSSPCRSETLLDTMHKRLYPDQYNKQNRTHSADSLMLSKNGRINQSSNYQQKSATMPQTKPSNPPKIPPRCPRNHPANDLRSKTTVVTSSYNSDVEPMSRVMMVSKASAVNEGESSVDAMTSPSTSSGVSETSPSYVKEKSTYSSSKPQKTIKCVPSSSESSAASSSTISPSDDSVFEIISNAISYDRPNERKDFSRTMNFQDMIRLEVSEEKLIKTCQWLISSGFPQYIQLYKDGHFPVALTTIESDHAFLDQDCLSVLLQWLTSLNKLTNMKIQLPKTCDVKGWFIGEMLFALSPNWKYDPTSCRWIRTKQNVPRILKKSASERGNKKQTRDVQTNSELEKLVKKSTAMDGCISPVVESIEAQDEASVNLTSGYVSETSPISSLSTTAINQPTTCNKCDSSHSNGPANQTVVAKHGSDIAVLGGSKLTVTTCQGNDLDSCSENALKSKIQDITLSNGCNGKTSSHLFLKKPDDLGTKHSQMISSSPRGKEFSFKHPGFTMSLGRNRRSFYDNTSVSEEATTDPQEELDLILKELYRNIGTLDETLSNMSGIEDNRTSKGLISSGDHLDSSSAFEPALKEDPAIILDKRTPDADSCKSFDSSSSFQVFHPRKSSMSIRELVQLRKFCIVKLTSVFQIHFPSDLEIFNPFRLLSNEFTKGSEKEGGSGRQIFGVPLVLLLQRTGIPLPPTVTIAMEHLKLLASESIGIFRKPGVQSRIQQLQDEMEADPGFDKFESIDAYDLADVLKRYFRELPGRLLTPDVSQILLSIFTHVPVQLHLELTQTAWLFLPDVNRQVLYVLLTFLAAVASHSEENQMTASNLAVCFLPSFFQAQTLLSTSSSTDGRSNIGPKMDDSGQTSLWDQKAAITCITFLISNADQVFQIPEFSWRMLETLQSVATASHHQSILPEFHSVDVLYLLKSALNAFCLKESDWLTQQGHIDQLKLSMKLVNDDNVLPLWRCVTEVEASPGEILEKIRSERHLWDGSIVKWRIVEKLDGHRDIFHYVVNITGHESLREFCEIRSWKHDLETDSYLLALTSVQHPSAPVTREILRAITFASFYLVEPCGTGKSRVTHISRVDIRGHLSDWYFNVYGRLVEKHVNKINKAFPPRDKRTDVPETHL